MQLWFALEDLLGRALRLIPVVLLSAVTLAPLPILMIVGYLWWTAPEGRGPCGGSGRNDGAGPPRAFPPAVVAAERIAAGAYRSCAGYALEWEYRRAAIPIQLGLVNDFPAERHTCRAGLRVDLAMLYFGWRHLGRSSCASADLTPLPDDEINDMSASARFYLKAVGIQPQ